MHLIIYNAVKVICGYRVEYNMRSKMTVEYMCRGNIDIAKVIAPESIFIWTGCPLVLKAIIELK